MYLIHGPGPFPSSPPSPPCNGSDRYWGAAFSTAPFLLRHSDSGLLVARLAFGSQVPSRLVFTVAAETHDKIAPIPSVFSQGQLGLPRRGTTLPRLTPAWEAPIARLIWINLAGGSKSADVRDGSEGQRLALSIVVRFAGISRHSRAISASPLSARSGRSLSYSITRSARASKASGITMPSALAAY